MSFKHILVALDRAPQAPLVFRRALELAKPRVTNLMVMHTLPLESAGTGNTYQGSMRMQTEARELSEILRRYQQQRFDHSTQEAKDWLQMYKEQAIAHGIPAQIDCRPQDPGLWICCLAQSWGADLIILGSHHRPGSHHLALGSVSNYVMQHAPCSVLMVHGIEADTSGRRYVTGLPNTTHSDPPAASAMVNREVMI
jgi:nucleotide-binding universal stress UspA family protein